MNFEKNYDESLVRIKIQFSWNYFLSINSLKSSINLQLKSTNESRYYSSSRYDSFLIIQNMFNVDK